MRIWFELSNSPHVNLFYKLIRELEFCGHEIIITARPLANTIDLLEQNGLNFAIIGIHYGKNIFKKLFGFPIRVIQLYKYLKPIKIDLAVSQSSFHSPVVAKLLGIPSIYTNDNEHALGNIPAFICATKILIPENFQIKKITKNGISIHKVIQYPGLKEGIFLWSKADFIHKQRLNNIQLKNTIFIRPEPQTAQYYNSKFNFLDELIISLKDKYNIIILARTKIQQNHYGEVQFQPITVPIKPLSFEYIASQCSLFIGAGGSMTREFAILGIPTISVYQDELLDVDRFLLSIKMMFHEPFLTAKKVDDIMLNLSITKPSMELIHKGKLAYCLFKKEVLRFDKKKPTVFVRNNTISI